MILMRKYLFKFLIAILPASTVLSNVIISLGDVDVQGYTNEIIVPVTLENPNSTVGGFQFDFSTNDDFFTYPPILNFLSSAILFSNNSLGV